MTTKCKTLLLVEDDTLLAMTESHWLKKAGYNIIHVLTGEEAIQTVNVGKNQIDLILMDINLGSGIDGTQTAQEILRENDIPLLFLSSHTEKNIVEKTEQITSYGYVVKDSHDVVLLASIKMAFKFHDANIKLVAQKKALHLSEEKFSKAFYTNPDAININRLKDGVYYEINEGFTKLTGYTKEDVIGRSSLPGDLDIWVNKEDRDILVKRLMDKGEVSNLEAQFRFKNSAICVGLMSARIIEIEGEQYILSITRDITDRKQTEEILRINEEKYRLLLELAPDSFFQGNEKGNFITVNNKAVDLTGFSREELLTMNMKDLFPKEIINEKPLRYDLLALGETIRIEREILRKDGSKVPIEMESKKMPDNTFQSFMRDISQRKISTKILEVSEERYRTLYDLSPSGIFLIDLKGKILDTNSAACKSIKYLKEEIIGKDIRMLAPPQNVSQVDDGILKLLSGETLEHEVVNIAKDGTPRIIELRESLISLPDGSKGILSISNDITERKEIEDKLKYSEIFYRQVIENTGSVPFQLIFGETLGSGYYKFIGNKIEKMLGIKPSEVNDNTFSGMILKTIPLSINIPIDPVECRNKFRNGELKQFSADILVKSKTGELKWLHDSSLPIWDESHSKVIGAMGILMDISERKYAEEILKKSEEKFRNLIEKMPDGVYKSTHEGKFLEVNQALVQMLGYDNEDDLKAVDIKKDLYFDITDRESAALIEKYEEMAVFRLRKKDGSEIWVEDHGRHVLDDDGNALYHEGIIRDVSERMNTERSLRESEERFRTIFENNSSAIAIIHPDTTILMVNDAYCQLSGYTKKEVVGMSWTKQIPPDDLDRLKEYNLKRLSNSPDAPTKYDFKFYKKNGEIRHGLMSVAFMQSEREIITSFIDITDRKRADDALHEMNEIFRLFMKYNPVYVFIKDEHIKPIYLSANYEKLLGRPINELLGKSMYELFPSELSRKMVEDDKNILRERMPREFIEELDGRIFSTLKFPIIINGVPKYLAGYTTDITDRRANEIQLHKFTEDLKMANAAKDKFFSIIAHDLKNPFHSINSALKLILNEKELLTEDEKTNFLISVLNTSEKAYSLLENLLLWSRSQMKSLDFNHERIEIYEVILQNIELLKNSALLKNISIINRITENNSVYADRNSLETIVRNLLSNAIKFTKDDGTIEIDAVLTGDSLEVSITDNGIGIEAENLEKLFKINQAFSTYGTKKESGSGLGLILCKEFVEKNNGRIWIESELDIGTKVKFTLPTSEKIK